MLWTALGFSVGIQVVMFFPAYLFKTDKLTDASYGLSFVFLSLFLFIQHPAHHLKILLLILILLWASRLTGYLFIRIRKMKKDDRFDGIRENFWKFLSFWVLQGLTVWVVLLPALLFFIHSPKVGISPYLGAAVWLTGFLFESVADLQKYRFKREYPGRWVDWGLWKISRHPNYFGEILCWVGVYVFVFSSLPSLLRGISLVSPAFILFMLLFVSGIPKLEKRAESKWGKNEDYREYKRKTSLLVPFFPKK